MPQINAAVLDHLRRHGDTDPQQLAQLYGNPHSGDRSLSHIRRVRRWWLGEL
jgi:hypothetical protein